MIRKTGRDQVGRGLNDGVNRTPRRRTTLTVQIRKSRTFVKVRRHLLTAAGVAPRLTVGLNRHEPGRAHAPHRDRPRRPPHGLPAERLAHRHRRPRRLASSDRDPGPRLAVAAAEPGRAVWRAPRPRRRRTRPEGPAPRRRAAAGGRRAGVAAGADDRRAAEAPFPFDDRDRNRPDRQHQAHGPLPLRRQLLHAVRGGGLSPDHLFPRPAGRAFRLHDADRGGAGGGAGPARQRQSNRERRRPRHEPPLRGLARSASEALLPLRPRRWKARQGRRALHDERRPGGRSRRLCRARQGGPRRLRPRCAEARDALGRARLRPRVRSRRLQHRRRIRLQHGRDGEQGPQHLQRQIRPRLARDRDRRATTPTSRRSSRTSIFTTGPATGSLAATGSSFA